MSRNQSDDSTDDLVETSLFDYDPVSYTPPTYPSAFEESNEEFFYQLRLDLETLSELLLATFPTVRRSSGVYIQFGQATTDQFERFITTNPHIATKSLLAACQLTYGSVKEVDGIENLRSVIQLETVDTTDPQIARFIELCQSKLTCDRHIETVLLPYFRHRERHEKSRESYLYGEIMDEIRSESVSCIRGTKVTGHPNVVVAEGDIDLTETIPDNFVAATAIRTTRHELLKRAKAMRSRLERTGEAYPDCYPALLVDLQEYPVNTDSRRYRETRKKRILELGDNTLERVFFIGTELDDFTAYCTGILADGEGR